MTRLRQKLTKGVERGVICLTRAASLVQVEIDYKAECNAGDTIESLGSPVEPISSNGSRHLQHYLHTLQRSDGSGVACELVRCRTSWTPRPAPK